MNTARTETAPSQTVEAQDVGDVIRGRFPEHLEQDSDQQAAAATAEANGRIDVRDFSGMLSGLNPEQGPAVVPAESAPAAAPAPTTTPAAPTTGTSGEVWRIAKLAAKAARDWTAEHWSAEAERRSTLRTERLPELKAARAAYRAARRADPARTSAAYHRARHELRKARRRVPNTLPRLATKLALGAAALGAFTLPHVPTMAWVWTGLGLAATAVIGLASIAAWVKRHPKQTPDLVPTEEETRLLDRLQPEYWTAHAEARGLDGTLTTRPELTSAGIVVGIRLDGKWTLGKLLAAEESVRALLGARTELRMQFSHGTHGGWAALAIRTRSAADGDDLLWSPENTSFGIDTITGEVVTIPLGHRVLIAGMSGAGKSVASRPLLRDASEGETDTLVIFDFKKVEGRLWDHRARVASTPIAAVDLADELVKELTYRLDTLPKGKAKWTPTKAHPRITVVVDEGAEAVSQASAVRIVVGHTERGKEITEKRNAVAALESLARMGRAGEIHLMWMTQKPTMSGPDLGIPPQIASQMGLRICLAVTTPTEARTVLGEDAQAKGWTADELPAPGVAFVRGGQRKPHPIAVRYMDDDQVIALPDRPLWRLPEVSKAHQPSEEIEQEVMGLTLVQTDDDGTGPADDEQADEETPASRVLAALAAGPLRQKEIEAATGLPKSTLSRTVNALIGSGQLTRRDGTLILTRSDSAATGA